MIDIDSDSRSTTTVEFNSSGEEASRKVEGATGASNRAIVHGLELATFIGAQVKSIERWHVTVEDEWLTEELHCDSGNLLVAFARL